MTEKEQAIHQQAILAGANYIRAEWPVISSLRDVAASAIDKKTNKSSLFKYATAFMGLSDSTAQAFITVTKKSLQVRQLCEAITSQELSVWKATRLVSAITNENASELIRFAKNHTDREVDFEVAKRNPKAKPKDKVKVISEDCVQVTITMSKTDFENLKRVESLEAQKQNMASLGELVGICVNTHLDKHDPVRKAERATPKSILFKQSRKAPAAEIHKVNLRDKGRCTHIDEDGQRCDCDRWVELHHIHPYAHGGLSNAENLTTLCWYHHKMRHTVRAPSRTYRATSTKDSA